MDIKFMHKAHKLYAFTRCEMSVELLCDILKEILECSVSFISYEGALIAGDFVELNEEINERLLNILSTQENVSVERFGLDGDYETMVVPVNNGPVRVGTIWAFGRERYEVEDVLLSEMGAVTLSLLINKKSVVKEEELDRVRGIMKSLSRSEIHAFKTIMDLMNGDQGLIVCTRIADENNINRSVVTNGIQKLAAGGLIEERSFGRKGTFIRIVDREMMEKVFSEKMAQG